MKNVNQYLICWKKEHELLAIDIMQAETETAVYETLEKSRKWYVLPYFTELNGENVTILAKKAVKSYVMWELRNGYAYENAFKTEHEDMESTAKLAILEYFHNKTVDVWHYLECWENVRKTLQNFRNSQRKHDHKGSDQLEKVSIGMYGLNRYDKPLSIVWENALDNIPPKQAYAVEHLVLVDTPNVYTVCCDLPRETSDLIGPLTPISRSNLYRFAYRGLQNIAKYVLKQTKTEHNELFLLELTVAINRLKKKVG